MVFSPSMKLFLMVVAAAVLLIPQANQQGITYTARMEKQGRKSLFTVWASDTRAKISVSESDDPSMPAGFTVIALDRGQRYIVFIPGPQQTYVDLAKAQWDVLRRQQNAQHGLTLQDPKLEELAVDGDGGFVAGVKTHYYKIRISVQAT